MREKERERDPVHIYYTTAPIKHIKHIGMKDNNEEKRLSA